MLFLTYSTLVRVHASQIPRDSQSIKSLVPRQAIALRITAATPALTKAVPRSHPHPRTHANVSRTPQISSAKGKSRLQQVVDWLGGEAFDGCLVFDECHKAKNFIPGAKVGLTFFHGICFQRWKGWGGLLCAGSHKVRPATGKVKVLYRAP